MHTYVYTYTHHFPYDSCILGHLDCFCILATVCTTVLNIGVQISFPNSVFGVNARNWNLQGHREVRLFLVRLGNKACSSM